MFDMSVPPKALGLGRSAARHRFSHGLGSAQSAQERSCAPRRSGAGSGTFDRMTVVTVETNHGAFTLHLDAARAPKTVASFLAYVDAGHYEGTVFHRVIPGFMAQGGGYDQALEKRPVRAPLENEANNGRKNLRGTVAMARTSDPHSATAQFFVNVSDNAFLDHTAETTAGWGYAVFGEVTSGMDVVDRIVGVATGSKGPFAKDAPLEDVVIRSIRRG